MHQTVSAARQVCFNLLKHTPTLIYFTVAQLPSIFLSSTVFFSLYLFFFTLNYFIMFYLFQNGEKLSSFFLDLFFTVFFFNSIFSFFCGIIICFYIYVYTFHDLGQRHGYGKKKPTTVRYKCFSSNLVNKNAHICRQVVKISECIKISWSFMFHLMALLHY